MKKNKSKREHLSQKTRFEVFKRDSFVCQYCGQSAPEVILHVDHIKPVAMGGDNDLINLITSCFQCNSGKGVRELDDNSVMQKQRKQLEELNERRNQLEMMLVWKEGLLSLEDTKLKKVIELFEKSACCEVNEAGKLEFKKWIKKFDYDVLFDSIEIATTRYLVIKDNRFTNESINIAFSKIPSIAIIRSQREKPYLENLYYIRGILRKRFGNYLSSDDCLNYLENVYLEGLPLQKLQSLAKNSRNWSDFKSQICDLIDNVSNRNG